MHQIFLYIREQSLMSYTSTIKFSCPFENDSKTEFLRFLEDGIFILKYAVSAELEGFSYEAGEKKDVNALIERLDGIAKQIKSKKTPENFLETQNEFFESLCKENNDWGSGLIDLEENNIEFNESICSDGYSMVVFCSFMCRSKDVESAVNTSNLVCGDSMDLSNIEINDYDENYISM